MEARTGSDCGAGADVSVSPHANAARARIIEKQVVAFMVRNYAVACGLGQLSD